MNKKLRSLRESKGLTQTQLAEKLNLVPSAVNNYEKGIRVPDLPEIKKMADIFDLSVSEIVNIFLPFSLTKRRRNKGRDVVA